MWWNLLTRIGDLASSVCWTLFVSVCVCCCECNVTVYRTHKNRIYFTSAGNSFGSLISCLVSMSPCYTKHFVRYILNGWIICRCSNIERALCFVVPNTGKAIIALKVYPILWGGLIAKYLPRGCCIIQSHLSINSGSIIPCVFECMFVVAQYNGNTTNRRTIRSPYNLCIL